MSWERDNYQDWELHPDVRTSTHLYTKWAPVNVTLDTPGVAQDVFNVENEMPTVNIVRNPSFENGIAYILNDTTTIVPSHSTSFPRTGSYCLSLVVPQPANHVGTGVYFLMDDELGAGGSADTNTAWYMVASVYIRADTSEEYRIEIRNEDGSQVLATGNAVSNIGVWERSHVTIKLPTKAERYRIYFVVASGASGSTFVDFDDVQIEIHQNASNLTAYCDGDQGNYHEWFGTPHDSISRRRIGLVSIRGFQLHASYGCYVALDQTASLTFGTYMRPNSDWDMAAFPVYIRKNLSFINEIAGEQPRITGAIWGTHVLLAS